MCPSTLNVIKENLSSISVQQLCLFLVASSLPDDDGEFYQFCYIGESGQVRGASVPFQFSTIREEFVEVEDEDNDILVIKSKTTVLEDELQKALEEEKNLKKVRLVIRKTHM